MSLKSLIEKFGKRDKQFKQAQREEEIRDTLEKRKKTANERDLERRMEEKRQEQINIKLQKFKDEEKGILLKSNMMSKENMFNSEEGSNMLKQRNVFEVKRGSNLFFS